MKKNLTTCLAIMVLLAGCSKRNTPAENENTSRIVPNEEAMAAVNASTVQQSIQGFGGMSHPIWIGDLTNDQRTKAFSTTNGIGMSILRVSVPENSNQFAAEKPTIDAAKSFGATVIASAWTAPASMKNNNSLVGGKLNTSAYASYAAHLRNFCTTVGGVLP